MHIHGKDIRLVALLLAVMLTGFFCLSAWAPGTDAEKGKTDNSTSVTSASIEEDTPGMQEQEAPAKVAKKRFPWLWVAAGVVVVGVVLYFTVIKKPEYKLNVSLGAGVSGTPVAGAFVYKKGKNIHYLYSLGYGYRALKVMLDNKDVAVSGDFIMDRDHVLAVTSEEQFFDLTVITSAGVTGSPAAGTYSYKYKTSVPYSYAEAAGYTNLKVQVDGVDAPASGTIVMDRIHALSATAEKIGQPFDVTGMWQFTSVCSTGVRTEGTLRFIKSCESEICQRVTWINPPGGGIGFWHYEGAGIFFTNTPSCLSCICESQTAKATAGSKAEYDSIMECQGSFADNNHMSGSFIAKNVWFYGGGGEYVIGTGTWSAYRL